jgi:hypothetical protein
MSEYPNIPISRSRRAGSFLDHVFAYLRRTHFRAKNVTGGVDRDPFGRQRAAT